MNLSNLKPAKGSVRKRHRIGRGQGSGWGETSGRGFKGARSRSGYSMKRGHEGGQMPLQRRLPKRGFNNKNFETKYVVINLTRIQQIADANGITKLDAETLFRHRIIKQNQLLKVLSHGTLKSAVEVWAHAFSAKATEKIKAGGGSANIIA